MTSFGCLRTFTVAVGEPLEGRLEASFEFVAEREDVLVDSVVRVDVRGLPVVADPAVAGFGERTDRILVGVPARGLQVPVLEFGRVRIEVLADERDDFGEQRQVDACREEALLFEQLDQRGNLVGFVERLTERRKDFLLLLGRKLADGDVLERLARGNPVLPEVQVDDLLERFAQLVELRVVKLV